MSVFELRSVTAGYGAAPVLRGLDLSVGEGEFISVIGPNGAGKSTLLRVLSGDIIPTGGEVLFDGTPLREFRRRDLARRFSIVHQAMEVSSPFTVRGFIALGRFPHQGALTVESVLDRERIDWAADTAGVGNLMERHITELSGGELQLVRIAHALAQNSRVLVLDEPVSHLDIQHTVMIMDLLWKLHREGATVMAVLHDINIASDYSDRIIGVKDGSMFFNGRPEDVLKYESVEALFGTSCIVMKNPTTGRPFVYPVPGYVK